MRSFLDDRLCGENCRFGRAGPKNEFWTEGRLSIRDPLNEAAAEGHLDGYPDWTLFGATSFLKLRTCRPLGRSLEWAFSILPTRLSVGTQSLHRALSSEMNCALRRDCITLIHGLISNTRGEWKCAERFPARALCQIA
jgi:hypothetical protein